MIGRKSILFLVSQLTGQFFSSIIYIIAVNLFLPIDFGYQKIVLSFLGLFNFIGRLGFDIPHLKIMAEQDEKTQNQCFTTFLTIRLTLSLISSVIIISPYMVYK